MTWVSNYVTHSCNLGACSGRCLQWWKRPSIGQRGPDAAILVDQGVDRATVQALVVENLPQTRVLPEDSLGGDLDFFCRPDAFLTGFRQPLFELGDVFFLPLPVASLVVSQPDGPRYWVLR